MQETMIDDIRAANGEKTITPFCYPKASLLHKQSQLHEKIGLKHIKDLDQLYTIVFKKHKCWDTVPNSSKLIILDTKLKIHKAFYALRYNGLRAAPLWDSSKQAFVGMLTITDFINLLIMKFEEQAEEEEIAAAAAAEAAESSARAKEDVASASAMSEASLDESAGAARASDASSVVSQRARDPSPVLKSMNDENIEEWCQMLQKRKRPFIGLDPDESLYVALDRLLRHKVHRLPLMDRPTGDPLYILTHKRLLRFLFLVIYDLPTPDFMYQTLVEANIGTFNYLATVTIETRLIDALKTFVRRRVSALPVLNAKGELLNIYSKFDVIHLAKQQRFDQEMTMKDALEKRPTVFDKVISCKRTESVAVVSERIARNEVHRLVVTDDDNKVIGILSLSDLLKFLIFRTSPPSASRGFAPPSSSSFSSNATLTAAAATPDWERRGSNSTELRARARNQSDTIPEVSEES